MCGSPKKDGAASKGMHTVDFNLVDSREQSELLMLIRQNHDELTNQFTSLREELLLAISQLQAPGSSTVTKQKEAITEHNNVASPGSSKPEVEPGMFTSSMLKCEQRDVGAATQIATKGVSGAYDEVGNLQGSSLERRVSFELDAANMSESHEAPSRQLSEESSFSILNIYDPADQIHDEDEDIKSRMIERTHSMLAMLHMSQRSVKAWKQRIDGQGFDLFMGFIILTNALCMSIQLEYEGTTVATSLGLSADTSNWPSAKIAFIVLQHLFTIVFAFEIIFRACVWGLRYYRSPVNFMDLAIVMISLLDLYVLPCIGFSLPNMTFLRLLRLVKLARVLRMVRVFACFRHLRVLIHSISSSIGALMWSMLFLALIHLITAILMTQSLQSWLHDSANDFDTRKFVYDRFGTFFRSCITLFEMTLAPGTWAKIGRVLIYDVSVFYVLFFSFYVPVVTFGITRVMTALFLRETFAAASSDKDMVVEEQVRAQRVQKENLRALFDKIDLDGSGVIYLDELQKSLKDPRSKQWLHILEVDGYEVVQLFQLLDKNGDGRVTFDDFSKGIMRLRGGAKSIDLISVLRQNAEMSNTIQALAKSVYRMRSDPGTQSRSPVSEQTSRSPVSEQQVVKQSPHGTVDL